MSLYDRFSRSARWAALGVALVIAQGWTGALAGGHGAPGAPPVAVTGATVDPCPTTGRSPFLLEETRVHTTITGPVAHVVVTQHWVNPNHEPVDGLYIFPLPEDAAVTDMSLRIGGRVVRGEMRRREEARAAFEAARREGRVAGLLDQERPNVFAQQVANIMPDMRVEVVLSFDHPVKCESNACEYVFPTVVGPRFIPASLASPGSIDPPVVPEGQRTGQRLSMDIDLDAGVSLHEINSPSHRVTIHGHGSDRASVALDDRDTRRLDRDFRLRWEVGADRPEIGLLTWRDASGPGEPGHFTLIVQPPASPDDSQAAPREITFVLDCSGSMSGVPIEAAKNVIRKALRAVRPGDSFQIIRFSERASGLGPVPLEATPSNIDRALRYLDSLHGEGGTQMIEGIRAALARPEDPARLRIVAFLTDGYIGNEREILSEVSRLIGSARLFSFGIGSSVNRYLLEGLAEEGRGVAAFLAPRESPEEMVDRFVDRIDMAVLTDIRVTWEDREVTDIEPARIPDLFAGGSLLLHGRYATPGTGVVVVEGRRDGRWESYRQVAVFPEQEADNEALGRLWARARIHRLEREQHGGEDERIREQIVALGLAHRLVTPWTSLVAVDSEISNETGSSRRIGVPVEMPQDVAYEGIFGSDAAKIAAAQPAPAMLSAAPASRIQELVAGPGLRDFQARSASSPLPEEIDTRKKGAGDAAPRDESMERTGAPGSTFQVGFTRISLYRADASRIVVEEDGEVWVFSGSRRRLVRTLSPEERMELGVSLGRAGAASWGDGALSGARLVIHGPGGRTSIAAAAPEAAGIVALLEAWLP